MKIELVYEIQAKNEVTVRAGYTQYQSKTADQWTLRFGHLAAFVGWNHEIDSAADSDSEVFRALKNAAPDTHTWHELTATYEMAGLVAATGTPLFRS